MPAYELKLAGGTFAVWEGASPEDAARRYVDMHREAIVIGWRTHPRHGLFTWGGAQIIEPGHPDYGRKL